MQNSKTKSSLTQAKCLDNNNNNLNDRKSYQAPKIFSAEPLEVTATTCNDGGGALGKPPGDAFPSFSCTTLGS